MSDGALKYNQEKRFASFIFHTQIGLTNEEFLKVIIPVLIRFLKWFNETHEIDTFLNTIDLDEQNNFDEELDPAHKSKGTHL